MILDSHAHISTPKYDQDRDEVLTRAREAGLVGIVDVGCDVPSSEASAALAAAHPDFVWAAVGVHPHEAKDWDEGTADALRALAAQPRVVAIGECGLDFHYDHSPRDVQREVFRKQLRLARELDLPVVLHVREAYDEALGILDEEMARPCVARGEARSDTGQPGSGPLGRAPGDAGSRTKQSGDGSLLRGVSHCFTGEARQAEGFAQRGFGVSFTGVVTFKNAKQVQEAAKVVPPELLLVETDCPYMSPVPLRGKRCEPAFVVHTARALATLRGEDPDELFARTARNAARIFGLELPT